MSNTLSHNKVRGTRLDKFLAKIAGKDVGEITPKTELERQLNQIAENGGGGGDASSLPFMFITERRV